MQPLEFSRFFDPFMLSVDASGVVSVEVRPLRPFGASSPLRGGTVLPSAWRTKRPLWPPHGEQNDHYGRRMENKTAIMAAHGEQKGRYALVQSLSNPHQISTAPIIRQRVLKSIYQRKENINLFISFCGRLQPQS